MKTRSARTYASGFTLLELMFAITIAAILLGLGIPSFTSMIRTNRLASQTNDMMAALTTARSEAYKRGIRVSICASNAGTTACSGNNSWKQGWIVFTDEAGSTGTIDGSGATADQIIQRWQAPSGDFTYETTPDPMPYVSFMPFGPPLDAQINIFKSGCTGAEKRSIVVKTTGRVSLSKIAC